MSTDFIVAVWDINDGHEITWTQIFNYFFNISANLLQYDNNCVPILKPINDHTDMVQSTYLKHQCKTDIISIKLTRMILV